ncbi:MAG: type IV pilin [Halococcoides sp.]
MGLRDTWNDFGTGAKLLIGLLVAGVAIVGLVIVLVVLAAILGTVVLGLGGQTATDAGTAPTATFAITASNGELTVTHTSGTVLDADRTTVIVDNDERYDWSELDGEISDGDTFTRQVTVDRSVRVIYETDDGPITLLDYGV